MSVPFGKPCRYLKTFQTTVPGHCLVFGSMSTHHAHIVVACIIYLHTHLSYTHQHTTHACQCCLCGTCGQAFRVNYVIRAIGPEWSAANWGICFRTTHYPRSLAAVARDRVRTLFGSYQIEWCIWLCWNILALSLRTICSPLLPPFPSGTHPTTMYCLDV